MDSSIVWQANSDYVVLCRVGGEIGMKPMHDGGGQLGLQRENANVTASNNAASDKVLLMPAITS